MEVSYEKGYNQDIVEGLAKLGHKVVSDDPIIGFSAVSAISRARGYIEAMIDSRRAGSVAIS